MLDDNVKMAPRISEDQLTLPPDYNFPLNLEFLQRSPKELLHHVTGDTVWKLFVLQDKMLVTSITARENKLWVRYHHEKPLVTHRNEILNYIGEWFDVDTDLSAFYQLAAKDKMIGSLVKKFQGYRIIGLPDLFESLTWAVIGQQINLGFAYTLKQRFVETYGNHITWKEARLYAYPSPAVIAGSQETDLLNLQFSRQKARYVKLIAEAFESGELSKKEMALLPFDEAKARLMKIKGIGNWTANYALMKTFRYPNAFPLEDAGLHNAIRNLKGLPAKPTLDQVRKLFKKYEGWEAYATLYFWKSLTG